MSVLAEVSFPLPAVQERRAHARVKFDHPEPVKVGRLDGQLVDVSAAGARVRHTGPLKLGSEIRISFSFGRLQFIVLAQVLASRVISVAGGTVYETRFRFCEASEQIDQLVNSALSH